jgi:hypothetical protein
MATTHLYPRILYIHIFYTMVFKQKIRLKLKLKIEDMCREFYLTVIIYKSLNSQSCLFSYLLKQEKLFNSEYILDNSYQSEKIMIDRLYSLYRIFHFS